MYWHLDFFWQAIQVPFRSYLSIDASFVSPCHFISSQIWLITWPSETSVIDYISWYFFFAILVCCFLLPIHLIRYNIFIAWGLASFFSPLFLSLPYQTIPNYQSPGEFESAVFVPLCYLKLDFIWSKNLNRSCLGQYLKLFS